MYKARNAAQTEYGPVSAEVVRQWVAEGRLNSQAHVKLEGTDQWKPITEFPEFRDILSPPRTSPPPLGALAPGAGPKPREGLAVATLVLGIFAMFCFGPLTGIAAIITGHISLRRFRDSPLVYSGRGMALSGLILGYVGTFATFLVLPALLLPALAKAKSRAQSVHCVSNLKQIGVAARFYANNHAGQFPADFPSMSNELATPKILVCPADTERSRSSSWENVSSENISYELLAPGVSQAEADRIPVFRCAIHKHVCHGDSSVQQAPQWRSR